MPSQYQKKQYNDIFDKLPRQIKDIISSIESAEKVFAIAKRHHLQIDQAEILNQITLDVLMGITSAKNFPDEIKKDIEIEQNEASLIVNDINEELFKPVREIIEKTYNNTAPNKIRTISTVEENDDEHLHLTKHDILREIENPPTPIIRTSQIITEEKIPEISKSTEIEEYIPELTGNKIELKLLKKEHETENTKKDQKEILTEIQPKKTIMGMKLSGIASIEKGNKMVEETKKENPIKSVTDPYREPIE